MLEKTQGVPHDWNAVRQTAHRLRSFRGSLLVFGGGRDPHGLVRPRFAWRCGGDQARLAIMPTASYMDFTGSAYVDIFRGFGVNDLWIVDPRGDAVNDNVVYQALAGATGIIITGGDQKQLSEVWRGSLVVEALLDRLRNGCHMFVTSASTVALSDYMVAGIDWDDQLWTTHGLNLLPGITFETHVTQRGRHPRLSELAQRGVNPVILGLDEDTALEFQPWTARALVIGTGAAHVHLHGSQGWRELTFRVGDTLDVEALIPRNGHANGVHS
jgi:cyanophycinase